MVITYICKIIKKRNNKILCATLEKYQAIIFIFKFYIFKKSTINNSKNFSYGIISLWKILNLNLLMDY